MRLEQAFAILGVDAGWSEEERLQAYRDLRERLESKRAQAPTSGLANKYSASLEQVDAAIEVVESSFDAKEFPGLVAVESPAKDAESPLPIVEDARPNASSHWRWALVGVAAAFVLVAAVWALRKNAEEQERLATEREAAAAQEAARLAEAVQAEKAAARLENRSRLDEKRAPILEALESIEILARQSEERLRDLKGAERVASEKGDKTELEIARYRLNQYEAFSKWLTEKRESLPALTKLDEAERLFEAAQYDAALERLEGVKVDVDSFTNEFEIEREKLFDAPVTAFLLQREYDAASAQSDLALAKKDYGGAIELLKPFLEEAATKKEARERLEEIYRKKSHDAFKRAGEAVDIGEFKEARAILATLDGDPKRNDRSADELALVEKLNSEYAYELALVAADEALEANDFELARKALAYLAEDDHVGQRIAEDLAWIDDVEEVWKRNQRELGLGGDELLAETFERDSMEPDTAPKLIRKVNPLYPDVFRQNRVSGFVDVVCVIGVDGKAKDFDIVSSSHTEFELPAIEALKRWRFQPAERNGVPVEIKVKQRMLFNPKG